MRKLLLPLLLLGASFVFAQTSQPTENLKKYAGMYTSNRFDGFRFYVKDKHLWVYPDLYRQPLEFEQAGVDTFALQQHRGRSVIFSHTSGGHYDKVIFHGFGPGDEIYEKVSDQNPLPLTFLIRGQPEKAINLAYQEQIPLKIILQDGGIYSSGHPSKYQNSIRYFELLNQREKNNPSILAALGKAYLTGHNRVIARRYFEEAARLDPANEDARENLSLFHPAAADTGWKLPYATAKLFADPTSGEVEAVRRDWSKRDLSVNDLKVLYTKEVKWPHAVMNVTIIQHKVHGINHIGAIVVPAKSTKKFPAIIELKGISPKYFPQDVDKLISPEILEKRQGDYVYIVPCFRGEKLLFDGKAFDADGDRSNALDGATDDALALLNVALTFTKQIDPQKIFAFGHSRGGTLALLCGERDKRIKYVLDWSGPADWFHSMGQGGWTDQEEVVHGLQIKADLAGTGGQFIERFLMPSIQGKNNLEEVRHHIIASSPLYFLKQLRHVQIHYGIEDEVVPLVNGKQIVKALAGRKDFSNFFHPEAGHDIFYFAQASSARFLAQ